MSEVICIAKLTGYLGVVLWITVALGTSVRWARSVRATAHTLALTAGA
jgi:hypothetical protein